MSMPIKCDIEVAPIGQERFHALDKGVMRHVFDIHNALGKFCDERIYQEELTRRCRTDGIEVGKEVVLQALHQGFTKRYYLDVLVERGVIYELKVALTFTSRHQQQLINYLLLAGLSHGKLVNFRPGSVESRFVSTSLCLQDRLAFRMADGAWQGDDKASRWLREALRGLLADWGVFLDVNLYREALLYLLDGPDAGVRPVDIEIAGRIAGSQKTCLLDAGTAWHLSSVREPHTKSYETHIARLLSHTRLDRIHWINLDHQTVTLKTLNNDPFKK